ncbi:DNA glycosylase AlkZ-like family protein [Nesterenkonia sandarakina]|uniref:Lhr family ATP dependent helicase n=1 Tax=Nesterenkonia sandarakina TaxID=272918 RepID=A0A2T0YST9_9MICC|nr:crosslink repair DNA glycosylase YcaQ family protein [Nesterenkonia sandarakina]PRZ18562.1 Lhr family ATP dependent helicase [Nesterenkonia sandarakina]
MTALEPFTEPTRRWFQASFGQPTAAQAGAWDAVARGKNALVVAPTGSGKTLSAFLWSIDRLFAEPTAGTSVLYISPLKALGVDIERNLRSPLVGIAHTARRLAAEGAAAEPAEITVGVRTGDSTPKERRDLVRKPPQILITTPESLYLMLTSQARSTLAGIKTVILDEVHALAGTKRGAHLAVSLERLNNLLESPAQRIGLSATVEPREEVARFLGGSATVEIVAPKSEKKWDITVSVPVEDLASPSTAPPVSANAPASATLIPAASNGTADPEAPAVSADASALDSALDALPADDQLLGDPLLSDQPLQPSIWPHVEHRIVDLVTENRSTIVFVNSRRLAEKLTGRINEIWSERQSPVPENTSDDDAAADPETGEPAPLARSHHGSVSKEQRKLTEEALKSGQLRCVVATSSLELGIDMGAVDLVIQVEAPFAVSAGLQRIGRAGHQVGEVSVGWFFPKHRGDLVSTAVIVERMLAGQIEALHIPRNPLDILAQQTVAAAAMDPLDVESWFETLRRSAPFATLPRSAYEATLDLLAGKYPSDRFAELRPRVIWDRDAGTITGRPGSQRIAVTSGGTIPDRGLFGVYLAGGEDSGSARSGGRRVGELDEEMVYESRVGDVFALGATSWRIQEITFDRVLVVPAFGQPASLPFWRGDGFGRPAELGRALGRFTREVHAGAAEPTAERLTALGMDTWAQENLLRYFTEQQDAAGVLPSDTTLVVEQTKDELGDWRIVLLSPYGLQVHAPWALAVGERLHDRFGLDGSAMASDDGIVLRVPMMDEDPPGAELFAFDPDELEDLVTGQVSSSALFAGRFREAAARALLLPKQNPGQRTPLWQQRQRSSQLLEVASGYPDFPVIMEAMREVLQDVYDMPALLELLRSIAQRKLKIVETTTPKPSPFAQSILFGYIAQFLYEGDSPLAERRAAALSVDPALLGELLGRVELREFLDAAIIADSEAYAQRLLPSRHLRGEEGVADLLRLLGPLTADQLAARLQEGEPAKDHAEALVSQQRAFRVMWRAGTAPGPTSTSGAGEQDQIEERYAAIEDASRLRDGLGTPIPVGIPYAFLDPVEDPLGDLVGRYARTHGPFLVEEAAAELGLSRAVVVDTLSRLVREHRVVEGLFRPDRVTPSDARPGTVEYCDAEMLRRIRRRSLAALRAQVEPVPTPSYAQFLLEWQGITAARGKGSSSSGVSAVAESLAQLSGAAAPASAWESYILPARIPEYRPGMLDELLSAGDFLAVGKGALSGHDGWLAFYPREDAEALLNRPGSAGPGNNGEDFTPTALQDAILEVLARGGAWFIEALHDQLDPDLTVSRETTKNALWELFWAGRVAPDSFAALRRFMSTGTTAHKKQPTPARPRHTSRRMALRRATESHRARIGASSASGPTGIGAGGRWQLVPHGSVDPTVAAHTRAEILLDRYGVVTRGSVMSEQQSGLGASAKGGFAAVYKVLSAAEDSGQIRRGYFIEQLGAAQFTSSATIDQLRWISERLEDAAEQASAESGGGAPRARKTQDAAVVLAATDPANPYGAALDWPELESSTHRPGRKAGAVVVLYRGKLVLYMERGGRTLLLFTEDESTMDLISRALVPALRAAKTGRIAVERVNGDRILTHPLGQLLRDAGFNSSPSGLRFAP